MKRFILFVLLLPSLIIIPQEKIHKFVGELPYRHYSTAEGLAGSNVLSFLQDKKGFIWFVTSTGLSRFDGKNFVNYTTREGLSSNNLTDITESDDSTIYISTYDRGIDYIKNNNIYKYEIKNVKTPILYKLHSIGKSLISYANFFSVISDNQIKNPFSLPTSRVKSLTVANNIYIYDIINPANKKIIMVTSIGLLSVNDFTKADIYKIEQKGFCRCSYSLGDSILIGGNGTINSFSTKNYDKLNFNLKLNNGNVINNILVDKDNNILFSISNDGIYLYKNNNVYNIGEFVGLSKTQINFIKKDDENNIWIGTFGKGVYCFYNNNLTNYSYNDGMTNEFVQCIQKDFNNKLLFGTINGISLFDGKKFKTLNPDKDKGYEFIKDIKTYKNKILLIGSFATSKLTINLRNAISNRLYEASEYGYVNCTCLEQINGNKFLLGGWGNSIILCLMNEDYLLYTEEIKIFNNVPQVIKSNKILAVSENEFWIGTTLGLCHIIKRDKEYFTNNRILSSNINDIKQDLEGRVWVAAENGVTYYHKGVWHIPDALKGNNIEHATGLDFDDEGAVWISSLKGIYRLKENNLLNITSDNGLISNDVNCIYYDKEAGNLWIGTNQGMSKLDIKGSEEIDHKQDVIVNYILSNKRKLEFNKSKNIDIPNHQKNVSISFSVPYYKYPNNVTYEYKFVDKEDDWHKTRSNLLEFSSLSPGKYLLKIRAVNSNNRYSTPAEITFTIVPVFTESLTFYIILISILILLSVLGTRKYLAVKANRINERKEIDNKILELKQQATSAMMNPHFIFNSLNSIQNFINRRSINEANYYLSHFAKLIRLNLDDIKNNFISLKEEIERLQLYLSLEKMRFGAGFNYFIKVEKGVNPDEIFIPNMIIQPFVENAIWHGILPNEEKGNVIIYFSFDKNHNFIIKISDNGVGYYNRSKTNKSTHLSKGINIIKEKLKLLNDNKAEELVKITPLENNLGTKVTISLPQGIYHFDTQ